MTTPDPFATPGDKIPSTGRPRGDAEDRAPVPRDPWDRYWIPNLDGTMPAQNKGFTRVSTLKDSAVDKRGININNTGLVAAGIATVPALAAAAARAVRDEDKKALRAIAAQAIDAAGGKDRSALGTAVHDATERINRGETDVHVPEEYRADVDSYYQLLSENNVRVKPEFMERVVLCPYNTAGTFDNIVEWFNPEAGELDDDGKPVGEWEWLIADLKTGRDLSYGYLEIMIQLWLYANAHGVLDLATNTYSPLPVEVRQDKAMVVHVPMAGGVAELWVIDISGAERYVRAAVELRRGNREAEKKWTKVGEVRPAPFVLPPTLTGAAPSSGAPLTNVLDYAVPQRTPQQIADAETAERRMAQVVGPLASATPEQLTAAVHKSIAETVRLPPAVGYPQQLDGEGKPLAPMAGPGKRGCSKCGRTGHRSTSKRCLGDTDPAKAVVDSDGASNAFMAELPGQLAQIEPADDGGREATARFTPTQAGADAFNQPTTSVDPMSPEPAPIPPWCSNSRHRGPEGWKAVPETGQWVCGVCGLPSKESYERAQVDPIAAAIDAQTTPEAVLQIRSVQVAAGKWTATYDEQARLKHQALSWPNP